MIIYGSVKLFKDTGDNSIFLANGKVAAATLFVDGKKMSDLGDEYVKTVFKPTRVSHCLFFFSRSIKTNVNFVLKFFKGDFSLQSVA